MIKSDNLICPECGKNESQIFKKEEILPVRGEDIHVESNIRVCSCGNELFDVNLEDENLSRAYDIFRKKHDILSPNEIKSIREMYGLSQRTLGKLLGWGEITVHRYESGAIPDASHNLMLKAFRNPEIVRDFLRESQNQIPKTTYSRALDVVQGLIEEKKQEIFKEKVISTFQHSSLDQDSGFAQFDFGKFYNAVLYFAQHIDLLWKTKLNKLMFYFDFLCFKEYTVSATGSKYLKFEHGPVPNEYEILLWFMEEEGLITQMPESLGEHKGHVIKALTDVDLDVFEEYEFKLLHEVCLKYGKYNSGEIREISHQEKGWVETPFLKPISYRYAKAIQLEIL